MSVDKLVDSTQLNTDLTSVANAIRAKSGGSSQLAFPSGFVSAIADIPSGGGGAWTEFTAASSASNGSQCLDVLFPNRDDRNSYFASLKSKDISDWVNNQLLLCHYYSNGHANGERYRNSGINGGSMQNNYDFVIEIGDTFWISEVSKA